MLQTQVPSEPQMLFASDVEHISAFCVQSMLVVTAVIFGFNKFFVHS
jgi:hypothetical protein